MSVKTNPWVTLVVVFLISSCTQTAKEQTKRTIVVSGNQFTEYKPGEFISWKCKDYVRGGRTLVELGTFSNPFLPESGFVLYDGTNEGEMAIYRRKGINHRWDWGRNAQYSFTIKPDGTGAYYDFSNVDDGESVKPNEIYKCSK